MRSHCLCGKKLSLDFSTSWCAGVYGAREEHRALWKWTWCCETHNNSNLPHNSLCTGQTDNRFPSVLTEHKIDPRSDGIFAQNLQPWPTSCDSPADKWCNKKKPGIHVSGSFKVLRRTWKVLSIQAVFHFFIQLMAVTLEEKGEDTGSEQLVMLMVLTRVSFPGQEPKILE